MSRLNFFARQDRNGRWCAATTTAKKTRNVNELKTIPEPFVACGYAAAGREYTPRFARTMPWGGFHEVEPIDPDAHRRGFRRDGMRQEGRAAAAAGRTGRAGRRHRYRRTGHSQPLGRVDELRQREGHPVGGL